MHIICHSWNLTHTVEYCRLHQLNSLNTIQPERASPVIHSTQPLHASAQLFATMRMSLNILSSTVTTAKANLRAPCHDMNTESLTYATQCLTLNCFLWSHLSLPHTLQFKQSQSHSPQQISNQLTISFIVRSIQLLRSRSQEQLVLSQF